MVFKTQARIADFNLAAASKLSVQHYRPNAQRIGRAARIILVASYILGVLFVLNGYPDRYVITAAVVFALVLGGYILYRRRLTRQIAASLQNSSLRSGVTTVTLTPEGFATDKPGARVFLGWEHFDDAADSAGGFILLLDLGHFQMIPSSALPSGAERAALLAQIKEWIAAAKTAKAP